MRSVPHRVVCLLGLDDGVFPRKSPRDGDDRLLEDPHVGERDPRTEDRQLLLDALMAATDRLIVTYTGNDERTNVPRPPAVPVGELLDMVDRVAGDHRQVLVRHPLHPFDARNFQTGAILPGRPWSFDRVTLAGAEALEGDRIAPGPFLSGPLPERADPVLEVDDLVRFVERPVRAFLRRRLGISVGEYADEVDDALPVELDHLEEWGVGQRVLDAQLAGAEPRAALLAEIARGTLPPGVLGMPVVHRIAPVVESILAEVPTDPGTSVDVRLVLPDGRTLSGTIPGVVGDVLRTVTYSRVGPRHRLAAWVRLLALTAAHPERPFSAVTAGRAPRDADADVQVRRIAPLGAEAARAELAALIDLYDRGMREPPPLACQTSAAYANAGANAEQAAQAAWESAYAFDKEDRDPEHQLVLGGVRPFADLLEERPRADETWNASEPSRFGRWARRLWDGLLEREE
jgi:exodeoxyribonuclease V gamma subunit